MKIILRMALIVIVSLILGIVVNHLNPDGIPAKLLFGVSLFPEQDVTHEINADSAFVFLFQENVQFIDIRSLDSYEQEHLPEALSLPFPQFFKKEFSLPDANTNIILYGEKEDSLKAQLCTEFLQKKHTNTFALKDGLLGWLEYGFPIEGEMP